MNPLAYLAPILVVVIVVGINVALFFALRSRSTHEQIDLLRKAGGSARNPWKAEEDSIDELSAKVHQLQNTTRKDEESEKGDGNG